VRAIYMAAGLVMTALGIVGAFLIVLGRKRRKLIGYARGD
jgi:uncharacterized membrane protein YbaN (DUF454 family)